MITHPTTDEPILQLHPGRDVPLRRGHPWVFEGAIARVHGEPASGDVVQIRDAHGDFVAWAFYSAHSQIRGRCVSWEVDEYPDEGFIRTKARLAWLMRRRLGFLPEGGVRVVNAEGDSLPGLVIDLFGRTACVQFHHPWTERCRDLLVSFVRQELGADTVIDRSQRPVRVKEGLPQSKGVIVGEYHAHPVITEHGTAFAVDARNGQKTGFYLDQRANRGILASWAAGRRVLDLYAHTGGFGLVALVAGAEEATFVESGSTTVELLEENLRRNGIPPDRYAVVRADVERFLATAPGRYDLIVVDPPPLARSSQHRPTALRRMTRELASVLRLAAPGALLAVFSCSHSLGRSELGGALAAAAQAAPAALTVLKELGADLDHPYSPAHPEGNYLCGFLCHVARSRFGALERL